MKECNQFSQSGPNPGSQFSCSSFLNIKPYTYTTNSLYNFQHTNQVLLWITCESLIMILVTTWYVLHQANSLAHCKVEIYLAVVLENTVLLSLRFDIKPHWDDERWMIGFHRTILTSQATSQIARFMGSSWGHLGPVGPIWVPCWSHEPCYQGLALG